jgi:hypothetical protein
MSNIRIYIDNQICDLPEKDLNLNLTYALKDRQGIAVNTGSRSEYSFELPATKNNDLIFSRFYDVSEDTVKEQKFLPAYIEVDGLPFFSGLAQLTSVTIDQDFYYWKGQNYKVSFYGNNVDWVQQLKNKFLYQYDYGTHTHDYTNIDAATYYSYPNGDTFKYILIKWKDWLISGQVDYLEYTPALFIKSIVDRIFSDIGYTYNSNFFSLASFEKLIMPIPLSDKINDEQFGIDYLNIEGVGGGINYSSGGITVLTQTVAPLIGPNPYDTINNEYIVPQTGFYLFEYSADITNITIAYGMTMAIYVNGTIAGGVIGSFNLFGPQPYTTDTQLKGELILNLNAGDVVWLLDGAGGGGGGGTADVVINYSITGEAQVLNGTTIDFRYFINKEWNSLDFIKGLAHAFNLTFQTDVDNKSILIEPANNYLNQSSNPSVMNAESGFYDNGFIDFTEDVDLSKGGEVYSRSDIQELVKLSWQYDSNDPTLEAINGVEDIALHQARFTFASNRFQKDEEVIENPFFSTTLCIADSTIQGVDTTKTPIIPIIWNDNYLENTISAEANYDIMPRILFTDDITLDLYGSINVYNGTSVVQTKCPVAYMVDYNSITGNFISLSFGSETVNGNYVQGLLERFYLGDFVRRQSGKEVECYIFWDALMVRELDFTKKIQIHGDNYILQEVNSYSVTSTDSTKTYLIYDDLGDGTEATQITNSLIIGKLNV